MPQLVGLAIDAIMHFCVSFHESEQPTRFLKTKQATTELGVSGMYSFILRWNKGLFSYDGQVYPSCILPKLHFSQHNKYSKRRILGEFYLLILAQVCLSPRIYQISCWRRHHNPCILVIPLACNTIGGQDLRNDSLLHYPNRIRLFTLWVWSGVLTKAWLWIFHLDKDSFVVNIE